MVLEEESYIQTDILHAVQVTYQKETIEKYIENQG